MKMAPRATAKEVREHLINHAPDLIGSGRAAGGPGQLMVDIGVPRNMFYKAFDSVEELVRLSFIRLLDEVATAASISIEHAKRPLARISTGYWNIVVEQMEINSEFNREVNRAVVMLEYNFEIDFGFIYSNLSGLKPWIKRSENTRSLVS